MDTSKTVPLGRRYTRVRWLLGLLAMLLAVQAATTEAAQEKKGRASVADCNAIGRKIVFAGPNWDSAQLHNHIAGTILQAGFGCDYTDVPGVSASMVEGLVRGDIDIHMEVWTHTAPAIFKEAEATGRVLNLGLTMRGVEHSFLVPRYVIEGDAGRGIAPMAPNLKSVAELPRYARVFQNPEQPAKGRYHNCMVGWFCELVNTDKLATYGLDAYFANFRSDNGDALVRSLTTAYEKGEAWIGYYWGPTWVLSTYDLVALEEPAYSDDCWVEGNRGCAFPPSIINVAVSEGFAQSASAEMIDFLRAYEVDQMVISQLLAYMRDNEASAANAARYFLKTRADVWTPWVSEEVAARVQATLK